MNGRATARGVFKAYVFFFACHMGFYEKIGIWLVLDFSFHCICKLMRLYNGVLALLFSNALLYSDYANEAILHTRTKVHGIVMGAGNGVLPLGPNVISA